jgi:hypothetical protein
MLSILKLKIYNCALLKIIWVSKVGFELLPDITEVHISINLLDIFIFTEIKWNIFKNIYIKNHENTMLKNSNSNFINFSLYCS